MAASDLSDKEKDDKPPEGGGKILRTVKSMTERMKLSEDEIKYRMENFDIVDVKKEYFKYLKCTRCNMNFQRVINKGETVGSHPLLGVLMCDTCCEYYGDGNFSLDSEGEDKYCRWCGEGGTIFACSKCICGFCDVCIKKHFGESSLEAVEKDDDWICYFCNPKPLWYLRSICFLAKEAAKSKRDQLNKNKEGGSVKKKRKKKENLDSDTVHTSSDSSRNKSSSSASSTSKKRLTRQKKLPRASKTKQTDESSSSEEDEKENRMNSRKRVIWKKKGSAEKDPSKGSSDSDGRNPKKKPKTNCEETSEEFERTKSHVLHKLKSIWRLTQVMSTVGLSSSTAKLKLLSKPEEFDTVWRLKKEHEELKSCMAVLASTLNTASSSTNSILEDLTIDTTKDDTETFRSQEIKLKTFAEKIHEDSGERKTSVDSGGDSPRKEVEEKRGRRRRRRRKERPAQGERKSVSREPRNGGSGEGGDESRESVGEGEVPGEGEGEGEEEGNQDSGDESVSVKPILKVKSFARMLDANVYDRSSGEGEMADSPVMVNLYDMDTEESENEAKKKEDPGGDRKRKSGGESERKKSGGRNTKRRSRKQDMNQRVNGEGEELEKKKIESEEEEKEEEDTVGEKTERRTKRRTRQTREFEPSTQGESLQEENAQATEEKKEEVEKEQESSGGKEKESRRGKRKKSSDGRDQKSSGSSENETVRTTKSEDEPKGDVKNEEERSGDETKGNEMPERGNEINETAVVDEEEKENVRKSTEETEGGEGENQQKGDDEEEAKGNANEPAMDNESKTGEEKKCEVQVTSDESGKKKKNSSDTDSEESDEKQNTIKRRKPKKEMKASFERFKRERKRFLTSSKESSTPESDKVEAKATKVLESSESESEKVKTERKSGRQKKKRILASSDEENGGNGEAEESASSEEKEEENQKKEEVEEEKSDSEAKKQSSETSSEEEVENKKRRRIKRNADSNEEERKREKKAGGSSSDSSEAGKKKKRRRNIKKILKKDSLQVETKEALKNEEERKKRLRERRKLFEELFPEEAEGGRVKRLILDFDPETKEPLVSVHKKLTKKLKPHQVKGVRFMWDSCFESVEKMEEESGSGCILAHCMGLGKTLQVITLVHTVLTHDLGVNTVLIVCPLSTVSNWIREFEMWLENIHTDPITLYDLVKYKKREERLFHLENWYENGGVLVVSYDLFRNLTKSLPKKEKKRTPKYQKTFEKTLLDPGPDLVICDEGHLLKNEDTALSKCMSRLKTSRRIVLTGTPLQNNLVEYHCMVQFVKPNILGTRKEFCNRFLNPINNGQFEDSTELDVKIMKRRSHVLHSMLDGCIQRFDYSVLTPFLPEKHEYVLSIALTETQAKAYQHFINNLSAKAQGSSRVASLFNDYHSLQRIWTHPRTMLMQSEKESQKEALERDSEGSLKDFVVSSGDESSAAGSESSEGSVEEVVPKRRVLRSNANDPEVRKAVEEEEKLLNRHWWDDFYDEKAYDDIRESNKLVLLFSLLKHCGEKKDKVLVFSQSLYSLDLIEYFLARIDEAGDKDEETLCGHKGTWIPGFDYFRLDGSTSSETRALWCKHFNKESNTRARLFLISTRAGGLGINLYGANRVVIFDASWNPSHDLQSIFRVYRFGQKKTCYVYRFLSEATMEEKIYERQVTKLSLAHRVVDEHQIERHYTMGNLQELYTFQPTPKEERKMPKLPKDSVLADLLAEHKEMVVGYHEHDTLLENKEEEELSEEERKAAWKEYEEEKAQKAFGFNLGMMQPMMMPEGQFVQGEGGMQFLNPLFFSQVGGSQGMINPMTAIQSGIPLEAIQRGMRVGVTPLPRESLEAFFTRIIHREGWIKAGSAKV